MKIDLDKIKHESPLRREYVQHILDTPESKEDQELIQSLIAVLRLETAGLVAQATAAYMLGKLKAEKAIPDLKTMVGTNLIPPSDKNPSLKYEPETALLEIGAKARPAVEEILESAVDTERITLATIMLFNLTQSKSEVKQTLERILAQRKPEDAKLFDDAFEGLKQWKG
ncbi:hypothetical protein Q0590_00140 [Rhodocytophaga aerolata]|uniref:HEAT repeat domain-containing protein n=1 Tax=Rhodocytophaga aerolata TaxID=455078 RepID=A0ABT8QXR7_9BACT|nr:hypothetical protein [Rhodocytophaga aerolata]MDO1444633.1 hypothetical protein [Rhodocytophaga aerolata]